VPRREASKANNRHGGNSIYARSRGDMVMKEQFQTATGFAPEERGMVGRDYIW
jgi:hypothetical protein